MKRVLIVYPPPASRGKFEMQVTRDFVSMPPLAPNDLTVYAAIAKNAGYEPKVADYTWQGDFEFDLKEFQPNFIIANISTIDFSSDMATLKRAKELLPSVKIIVVGAIFQIYNVNAIYERAYLDYVIRGEAELAIKEILENSPDEEIHGICYRQNFQGVKTPPRLFNQNPDDLPFAARELVNKNDYLSMITGRPQATVRVSYGCPFNCCFCTTTSFSGAAPRYRSVENVLLEVKECIKKQKFKDFYFLASVFDVNRDWVAEFCKRLIEENLKITWATTVCGKGLTQELANLMYKSGCRLVEIGVESGSQLILNSIGKKNNLDEIRAAVKIFKKSKIMVCNHFLLGLPQETEETIESTVNFAIELDSEFAGFCMAVPLPGTRFYDYVIQNRLFNANSRYEAAFVYPIARTHKLEIEKLFKLYLKAIKKFYLRPTYFIKTILKIRKISELKEFLTTYVGIFLQK